MPALRHLRRALLALALPIGLIVAWEWAFRAAIVPRSQLAPPSTVFPTLLALMGDGEVLRLAWSSLRRLLLGLVAGSVAGLLSGAISARFATIRALTNPTLAFLAPIPVVVWLPFAILFLGLGESYQIFLVGLASFLLAHLHSLTAADEVRSRYSGLAAMYQLPFARRLQYLYIPQVLPALLTSARVAAVIGWIVLFLVEFGSNDTAQSGLAFFIRDQQLIGRIEDAFAGVLLLAIVTFLLDLLLVSSRAWMERWDRFFRYRAV